MAESIDHLLVREDAVGGDEASELDSLLDDGSVLRERTRGERRSRKHAERRAKEFTADHVRVRRHCALPESRQLSVSSRPVLSPKLSTCTPSRSSSAT